MEEAIHLAEKTLQLLSYLQRRGSDQQQEVLLLDLNLLNMAIRITTIKQHRMPGHLILLEATVETIPLIPLALLLQEEVEEVLLTLQTLTRYSILYNVT